jgi:hypothetical protein
MRYWLGSMKHFLQNLILSGILAATALGANAADKMVVTIAKQPIGAYRTEDLEAAKKQATAANKPIAWIATSPTVLDGRGSITQTNGRGATLHAFWLLKDQTVLVYMDAYAENHKVPALMDNALHTPDPHYTPPTVLFLDPEATEILAKVSYEADYARRGRELAKALQDAKSKIKKPAAPKP